jgi:hypothetical protein
LFTVPLHNFQESCHDTVRRIPVTTDALCKLQLCLFECGFFIDYGPAIIEHVLLKSGFNAGCKLGKGFDMKKDTPKLLAALDEADHLLDLALQREPKVSQEGPYPYSM